MRYKFGMCHWKEIYIICVNWLKNGAPYGHTPHEKQIRFYQTINLLARAFINIGSSRTHVDTMYNYIINIGSQDACGLVIPLEIVCISFEHETLKIVMWQHLAELSKVSSRSDQLLSKRSGLSTRGTRLLYQLTLLRFNQR